jgi:hypothetical protein
VTGKHASARIAFVLVGLAVLASAAIAQQPDWANVDRTFGRKGSALAGGVVKYGFPRTDLRVTVQGVRLKPAFALGGWVAFRDIGAGRAMAMGDLVLTESEVEPVIRALQRGGVEQTALHNHLLGETPRILYMHVHATGDPVKIAQAIRGALAATKTPLTPRAGPPAAAPDLDTAAIARALGVSGAMNGGVYQVGIPRRDTVRTEGNVIPPTMGVATGINFQPTGKGRAAVTGDFVLAASEVNPVIRALTDHGIAMTALHSHMLQEQPRLFFMHFWGDGDAVALARGLAAALDRMAVRRPGAP